MLSLEKFKKELGDKCNDLTDEEIIKLKDSMEKMAELCFEMWVKDRKKDKE
jgi:hypothetical protein